MFLFLVMEFSHCGDWFCPCLRVALVSKSKTPNSFTTCCSGWDLHVVGASLVVCFFPSSCCCSLCWCGLEEQKVQSSFLIFQKDNLHIVDLFQDKHGTKVCLLKQQKGFHSNKKMKKEEGAEKRNIMVVCPSQHSTTTTCCIVKRNTTGIMCDVELEGFVASVVVDCAPCVCLSERVLSSARTVTWWLCGSWEQWAVTSTVDLALRVLFLKRKPSCCGAHCTCCHTLTKQWSHNVLCAMGNGQWHSTARLDSTHPTGWWRIPKNLTGIIFYTMHKIFINFQNQIKQSVMKWFIEFFFFKLRSNGERIP